MENQMNPDASTATVDEVNSDTQPVASSTPENQHGVSALRRSCRKKPVRAPCTDCQTGMHVRCFTNITGRRPIHSPRESKPNKSRGSSRNTRKSRGSANEDPELPTTSLGMNIELSVENSSALPEKRHKKTKAVADGLAGNPSELNVENSLVLPENRRKQTRVLASCLPRNLGPVTRRRSLLGFAIAAAKRKVEECGEISFTISNPEHNTIRDLNESAAKRARVDSTLTNSQSQIAIGEKQRSNEINVTLAEKAASSKEPELVNKISEVNGISNSIRLIRLDENRAEAYGISTQKEDCAMKEGTPETNRVSNSFEDFSKEQNKPQANEQSTQSTSFLIKDTMPAANEISNLMGEFRAKENMPQNELRLEENTKETNGISTPKGEVKMSEIKDTPTAILDITMSVKRRDSLHKNTSTPILSSLVDPRTEENSPILTISEDRIQIPDDSSSEQQSRESILSKEDSRKENQSNEEAEENATLREIDQIQDQRDEEENEETEEQVADMRSPENSNETSEAGNSRCTIM